MRDRRYVEDLTIEELEQELLVRRREERLERLRRLGARQTADGRVPTELTHESTWESRGARSAPQEEDTAHPAPRRRTRLQTWRERVLFAVEVAALLGLVVVIAGFLLRIRQLNEDWRQQQSGQVLPTPTATPLIRVAVLPGGHRPPVTQGGEAEPLSPMPRIAVPTPGPRSPTRIVIPAIGVDVPVVEGLDWEQLKKGAGHLIGSANPGERGNCFIAGHNDIYGEIFRDLEDLKVGDEILVYAGQQPHRYIVRATRIVEPDELSVMAPTSTPVLTLLTCYPYMIDSHRLVVIAELDI